MGIRNMMFHNEIGPGQKIAYRDLAERLGMSQTPVIQALKWLEFQGLVRHEPNRGYSTEPISIREVEEIYEFRETIELSLLEKTLQAMDETALEAIKAALDAHHKAAREVYLHERLLKDMTFHLELARFSGNRVQQAALRNLFDLLYLKYGGSILFSTSMDEADADHQRLFARIRERDIEGARRVLSRHIRNVREHVLSGLEKMKQERRNAAL
jgi:DNA-binding GntR family transcriptional regulator